DGVDGDVAHRGGGGGLRRAGAGVDGGAAGVGGGSPRAGGLLLRDLLHVGAARRLLPLPGPRPRRRQPRVHRRRPMLPGPEERGAVRVRPVREPVGHSRRLHHHRQRKHD
ncbi:hypothetical protein ACJX0J_027244, partial [Zea mays]